MSGISISTEIISLVPFKEESFDKLNEETDCIQLLEFFNDFGLNNVDDLKEFVENDSLYSAFANTSKDAGLGNYKIQVECWKNHYRRSLIGFEMSFNF